MSDEPLPMLADSVPVVISATSSQSTPAVNVTADAAPIVPPTPKPQHDTRKSDSSSESSSGSETELDSYEVEEILDMRKSGASP